MSPTVHVAIDTGGTFTDVAVSGPDGSLLVWKVPSTPHEPEKAVVRGLNEALEVLGAAPAEVTRFVHGTTVATNALLTLSGARVGLVTTEGFRDVLRIGRQTRPSLYDLSARRPEPLVRRSHTWEAGERIAADGSLLRQLEETGTAVLAEQIRSAGCESVVVSFLNAYANPVHEHRCAELLAAANAAPYVIAATAVTAELREYERTSTAVVNAYVQPSIASYLERLEEQLLDLGLGSRLWIMQSNGGLLSAAGARDRSVRTVLSGLAGGVMGAARWARLLELTDVVSLDVGGTSTDMALIRNGEPQVMTGGTVGGYEVRLPAVDVHTIGAGGGSIAWQDSGGVLRVGPHSAGADPGPVCYGRGGDAPTVTDAHLLLGRLDGGLLGGRMRLDDDAARRSVTSFAAGFGLNTDEISGGIVRVINTTMARGIRKVSVERGVDIRGCVLIAFGGAGPLHAAELIRELGMASAVIPPHPGIASAVGMLDAPVRHDFAGNVYSATDSVCLERTSDELDRLTAEAKRFLAEESVDPELIVVERLVDARYVGQSHELTIAWDPNADELREAFDAMHQERYGFADNDAAFELVTARIRVTVPLAEDRLDPILPTGPAPAPQRLRRCFLGDRWQDVPLFQRAAIPANTPLSGPLLIEQLDSTVVVLTGQTCVHDRLGFLHIRDDNHEGQPE